MRHRSKRWKWSGSDSSFELWTPTAPPGVAYHTPGRTLEAVFRTREDAEAYGRTLSRELGVQRWAVREAPR